VILQLGGWRGLTTPTIKLNACYETPYTASDQDGLFESVQSCGGKAQRTETTRKTKAQMEGWDHNGSSGDWRGVRIGIDWLSIGTDDELL
jgi:hypothetical protein